MSDQKPKLPDGTWAVTKEDKDAIVSFGRELTKFVFDYIAKQNRETFHAKIIAGGFQYFMDIQAQKAKLVGDDVLIAQAAMEKYGLGNKIDEPFVEVEIAEPTKEERIASLKAQLEILERPDEVDRTVDPASDPDVEDASIAPSDTPVAMKSEEETA